MKQPKVLLYAFTLMNFIIAMSALIFNGILDKVAESMHISIAVTGLLSTAYALGAAIGVPIVLIVFAKANRKKLMLAMLGLSMVSVIGVNYAPNFTWLLIFRVMMGIVGNSYGILAISTVSAMAEKGRQGRALAFLIMGNAFALIIGIPLSRTLSAILDWRSLFWILNGLTLVITLYFAISLPNISGSEEKESFMEELRYLKSPMTSSIILFTLIMFIGYSAVFTYATPYLVQRFTALDPWMSWILMAIGVAAFTGNAVGGYLSDHIGYAKSMFLGALLQLTAISLLIVFRDSMFLNVILVVAVVLSAWLTGLQLNLGILQTTHHDAHFILSLNGTGIQLGNAIGSSIAAIVISTYGLDQIGFIMLVSSILIVLIQGAVLRWR